MDLNKEPAWTEPENAKMKLSGTEVHLWEILSSTDYAENLGAAEKQRYARITNEDAKISYCTAQGGLRRVLNYYTGKPEGEMMLEREERGKPYITGGPEFNLSHTTGRVFAAYSSLPVGLDVESASRGVHAESLARRFFLKDEVGHILSQLPPERAKMFLRYWVCKEAMVKLTGDGIYIGLQEAHVKLEKTGGARGFYKGREVWIQEFSPGKDLLAALATWQPVEVKCFFRI